MESNKKEVFLVNAIHKGVPTLLIAYLFYIIWHQLLSEEVKHHALDLFSPVRTLDIEIDSGMQLFMCVLMWLLIWIVILLAVCGLFYVVSKVWLFICEATDIITIEETQQVLTVKSKTMEKKESTTYVNSGSVMVPISSEYTEYLIYLTIGNKESIEHTEEVDFEVYSNVCIGEQYKATVQNLKILGVSIDYRLKLSEAIQLD